MDTLAQFKDAQKQGWAHFAPLEVNTTPEAARLVKHAGVCPGHQVLDESIFVIVTLIVIGITYVFMRGAETLMKWFGETGIDAVSRVVGIVVAAIAVQLVINGVTNLTNLKIY